MKSRRAGACVKLTMTHRELVFASVLVLVHEWPPALRAVSGKLEE